MKSNAKTFLALQGRDFSSNSEATIIGYYRVKIPTHGNKLVADEVKVKVKKFLGDDIESIKQNKYSIVFNCYKGAGDFVETVEDVYCYATEIEDTVREAMQQAKIKSYSVVVELSTLHGGCFE